MRKVNRHIATAEREFSFTNEDFKFLVDLAKTRTGIVFSDHKRDLVYGRLARRLRSLGLKSFAQYRTILQGNNGEDEVVAMVNAMTTNLTKFFRESHHFDILSKQVIEPKIKSTDRRLRIWSAGCSSGEEPYSIAMTLHHAVPNLRSWDSKILATDIDTEMVKHAAAGIYDSSRMGQMPGDYLRRYFESVANTKISVNSDIRSLVTFKQLNLLDPWPMKGPFDVIFCRNVVIYFDKNTQRTLFNRFADLMKSDGLLFVGHSESLFQVTDRFRPIGRTAYRKVS